MIGESCIDGSCELGSVANAGLVHPMPGLYLLAYTNANPLSCFPRYDRSQTMLVQDFGPLAE